MESYHTAHLIPNQTGRMMMMVMMMGVEKRSCDDL